MPIRKWLRRAVPLAGLGLLLTACDLSGPQSIFEPAGPVAQEQLDLFIFTYWLSWGVLVLVVGVLIYAMIRYRRGKRDDIPPQTHGNLPLEIAWTILPTLIVIAVAVPTVRTTFRTEQQVVPTEGDVVINVVGYQWWWRFEYPDLGFVTANEIHIPVGARVIFNMTSADVLHALWLPKLGGKRDAIPNQNNQMWLQADEPGLYFGQCAELCLGAHAYMRVRAVAETQEDFDAWVAGFQNLEPQALQADPLIERGRQLFAQKGCTNCHTIDNYADGFTVGDPDFPNLTNFGLRTSLAAGVLDNTPENLARWLRDPQEVKPTNYMPTLWETDDPNRDEEIEAIVAYLLSLGTEDAVQAEASFMGGTDGN